MARYAYHIYPKKDIDYTMTTDEHPRTFVAKALKGGLEVAAANTRTRHELEQMYMDNPDSTVGKAWNNGVYVSEARRDSLKKGRMTSLRSKVIKVNGLGNTGG